MRALSVCFQRLRDRIHRSNVGLGCFVLVGAPLLLLGLPIILPVVGWLEVRDRRRCMAVARRFICVQCGNTLGEGALDRADAEWHSHVSRLTRDHPGHRFRLVRAVDAICTQCSTAYHYAKPDRTFTAVASNNNYPTR
jgi:hypothetical protein